MTKEQEEAIEYLEQFIGKEKEYKHKPIKIKTLPNTRNAIETVLNMLKEKDKKIEHQIEKRNNQKAELAILNEKQKEMNKLINTVKSYKGQMKKEIKRIKSLEKEAQKYFEENIKKDKIIDLMAEYIATLDIEEDICSKIENQHCDKMNFGECEDCIKQYFKSKAEKE